MKILCHRPQRTISRPVEVSGIGYITGADITLRFQPADPNNGVVFVRTDLDSPMYIPARVDLVTDTNRRTTLGSPPDCLTLVEHVLAALAGLRIDNCLVEINGQEPPGMDGSAQAFVAALEEAGLELQQAHRPVYAPEEEIRVVDGRTTLSLFPPTNEELRISYFVDYGLDSPISPQRHSEDITPENFTNEISKARTFLLETEAKALQEQGIGSRTTASDLLVFSDRGPIENQLRFGNEPARHKMLDILGDLALTGVDIRGHIIGYRSGHPLNVELAKKILARVSPEYTLPKAA